MLRSLPRPVAEYEVATRLESLHEKASDAELFLSMAVLLDLSGRLGRASTEYQRAFVRGEPRPDRAAALGADCARSGASPSRRRWWRGSSPRGRSGWRGGVDLPRGRRPAGGGAASCARRWRWPASREGIIDRARKENTDFPDDLASFVLAAADASEAVGGEAADAELLLREQTPGARTCGDEAVRERLESAVSQRREALRTVGTMLPKLAPLLLEVARERDPSPEVRTEAASLLR